MVMDIKFSKIYIILDMIIMLVEGLLVITYFILLFVNLNIK